MPKFDIDSYVRVHERITQFWADHPGGYLQTEIVTCDDNRIVIKASAHRKSDEAAAGIGHAEEVRGQGPVNTTSALENAETSAVGRALAMMGYEVKRGIASREEMEKAQRMKQSPPPAPKITDEQANQFMFACRTRNMTDAAIVHMVHTAGIKLNVGSKPLETAVLDLNVDELRELGNYLRIKKGGESK